MESKETLMILNKTSANILLWKIFIKDYKWILLQGTKTLEIHANILNKRSFWKVT